MKVSVMDLLGRNVIENSDDLAWKEMGKVVQTAGENEDVTFDFEGVFFYEPWRNAAFKMLIKDERVRFIVYNKIKFKVNTELICKMSRIRVDRVENIEYEEEVQKTPQEIRLEKGIATFANIIYVDDSGRGVMDVEKQCEEISSYDDINGFLGAMRHYAKENGLKKFKLILNVSINGSKLPFISDEIRKMHEEGLEVEVESNRESIMSKMYLHKNITGKAELSNTEKSEIVSRIMKINHVCLYIKFKYSKKTDEFGRYGGGESIACRAALYKGIWKKDGKICVALRTFKSDNFVTYEHYALMNDNDVMEGLEHEDLMIPINEVGFLEEFIGSKCHICWPIQYDPEDSCTLYGISEGSSYPIRLTVPERIKLVFDDWGILYNKEQLQEYIDETKKILG